MISIKNELFLVANISFTLSYIALRYIDITFYCKYWCCV